MVCWVLEHSWIVKEDFFFFEDHKHSNCLSGSLICFVKHTYILLISPSFFSFRSKTNVRAIKKTPVEFRPAVLVNQHVTWPCSFCCEYICIIQTTSKHRSEHLRGTKPLICDLIQFTFLLGTLLYKEGTIEWKWSQINDCNSFYFGAADKDRQTVQIITDFCVESIQRSRGRNETTRLDR